MLLHNAFAHRPFCTQTLLHTEAFTQRDAFTHRSFCMLSHTQTRLHTDTATHRWFYAQKLFTHRHVCARGYCGGSKLAILPQSLAIEPHFGRKGCGGSCEIVMFLATEPHFVRKGCRGHFKIANLFQSLWSNLISCERVAPDTFRAKGLSRTFQNLNFISVFDDRTSILCERGVPRSCCEIEI